MNAQAVRRRHIYHVQYEDGDSEDFDVDEYRYVYEFRQAIDTGKLPPENTYVDNENDGVTDADEDGWEPEEGASTKR
jgi:hypothetical protein